MSYRYAVLRRSGGRTVTKMEREGESLEAERPNEPPAWIILRQIIIQPLLKTRRVWL